MNEGSPTISIVDYNNAESLGVKARRVMGGPESELVDTFLNRKTFKVPSGHNMTIFREPRLESGIPDLVLVVWKLSITANWNKQRAQLKNEDLRVMQFIYNSGSAPHSMLKDFFSNKVHKNLDRLHAANMIKIIRNEFITRPLSESFAVRSILAIEAKIKEWGKAIRQALLNTWFSSESYLLVPKISNKSRLPEKAKSKGIGILTIVEEDVMLQKYVSKGLPRSYASWLFNEWAWRNTILE